MSSNKEKDESNSLAGGHKAAWGMDSMSVLYYLQRVKTCICECNGSIAIQPTFRMQSHFNLSCIFQILNLIFLLNIYIACFFSAILYCIFHFMALFRISIATGLLPFPFLT